MIKSAWPAASVSCPRCRADAEHHCRLVQLGRGELAAGIARPFRGQAPPGRQRRTPVGTCSRVSGSSGGTAALVIEPLILPMDVRVLWTQRSTGAQLGERRQEAGFVYSF